jgi:hypothetical protein
VLRGSARAIHLKLLHRHGWKNASSTSSRATATREHTRALQQ